MNVDTQDLIYDAFGDLPICWGNQGGHAYTHLNTEGIICTRIEAEQISQLRLRGLRHAPFLQTRSTTHRPNAVESPARHVTKQAARNDLRDALYASHKYSGALTMTRVIHSARPLASIRVLIVDFHWEYMTRDQKGEI